MTSTEVAPAAHAERTRAGTLTEVTRLIRALEAENVRYCHWKSNQHLRASMLGDTDLDVLVDRRDSVALNRALGQTTFKHVFTPVLRGYPAIESYLGHDADTGRMIHLHLHYQLTIGEKHLKGYRLDWEELLLATRRLDPDEGVYVTDPNIEIVLLLVRTVLKLRTRDVMLRAFGRPYLRRDALVELRWLAARIDPEHMARLARPLIGEPATRLLGELVAAPTPSVSQLVRFRRSVTPSLAEYRTHHAVIARFRRWSREGRKILAELAWRHFGVLVPTKRRPVAGGLIVAFVGPDGSGKSTVVREITRWLSLLDVLPIYLGSGQGPVSLPRRVLQSVASLVRPLFKTPGLPVTGGSWRGRGTSRVRTAGELLWVWTLSRERRRRAAQARRGRNCGMIVLCDRFPLRDAVGNDGPCLSHWRNDPSELRRRVAREELAAIQCVERLRPDLVIKLSVSPEVALQRKPDTPAALLYTKFRVLEQLQFSGGTRVVEVDATRPLNEVLVEVKQVIWNVI